MSARVDDGDSVVGGRYRVVRKIGSGSFGDTYLGVEILSGLVRFAFPFRVFSTPFDMQEVAIKMEDAHTSHPQLQYENKVYNMISGGVRDLWTIAYTAEYAFNGLCSQFVNA